jgi:hypothetical protein
VVYAEGDFNFLQRERQGMARPPCNLDTYLDWEERLASFEASGLSIDVFCLKEGVSKSSFYRWKEQLRTGIPASLLAERRARDKAEAAEGAAFVPISLKASPVEIELPNGGIVRLPLGVGQTVLVEVIRAAGALRPWKAPKS